MEFVTILPRGENENESGTRMIQPRDYQRAQKYKEVMQMGAVCERVWMIDRHDQSHL